MRSTRSPLTRALGGAAVAAGILAAPAPAGATPNFPPAIEERLGAPRPDCSICHECGVTGRGTVNTPWGSAMRARGLQAYDTASLGAALARMESDRVDSDRDGTIDVDAVRQGKDPNPPTCQGGDESSGPTYGCVGRVAPDGSTPSGLPLLVVTASLATAAWRRRRLASGALGLVAAVAASASLAACAPRSGAALAPRGDAPPRAGEPGRMAPIAPSALGDDLRAAGLDPQSLPTFDRLSPRQRERVMSTFTRALGIGCTDCHDRDDYLAPTREKRITVTMWNDLTRPNAMSGGVLYCDSCHLGARKVLDRRDKERVAAWMSDELVGRLERHDKKGVECETCHGDPFQPRFLPR